MMTYSVTLQPLISLSDEAFYQLCQQNPDIKFERSARGELIIMPLTGGETGNNNAELSAEFVIWNRQTKLGKVFDSSTCFQIRRGK